MDNTDKSYLDEIKADVKDLVKATVALTTKLDIYTSQHNDLETRLRGLEEYKHKQDGVNADSERRTGRIIALIIGSELLLFGLGMALTHLAWK